MKILKLETRRLLQAIHFFLRWVYGMFPLLKKKFLYILYLNIFL